MCMSCEQFHQRDILPLNFSDGLKTEKKQKEKEKQILEKRLKKSKTDLCTKTLFLLL